MSPGCSELTRQPGVGCHSEWQRPLILSKPLSLNLIQMSKLHKNSHPQQLGEISYGELNCFMYQAINTFVSAVRLSMSNEGFIFMGGLTCFWSQPQVALRGTAIFGTCG